MWEILAGFGAALATGVAGYFVARRKNSGSIDTSDAATLWAESQAMRKELRDEVVELRNEVVILKKELISAEKKNDEYLKRIDKLIARVRHLEREIKKMGGTP